MNLISCSVCGVVLDKDRIPEPENMMECSYGECLNPETTAWDGDEHETTIHCPCCKSRIFYKNGEEV
jgi:DNA-directed RNA polymerase subunit RPC12/RpoP